MSWPDQEENIFTKKFGDRLEGSHKEHLSFGIHKLLDQRSNNLNTLDEQNKADVQNSDVETQKPRKKRTMKKPRTCFTKQQIAILEARFVHQKYLGSVDRGHLAAALQMTDSQVKTWFQNRRTKWRRLQADELAKQGLSQAAALAISVLYGRTHNQGDEEYFEEDDE